MYQSLRPFFRTPNTILVVAATLLILAGCAGTPITAHPTEEFIDTDVAKSLVGTQSEEIYRRFGEPDWRLEFADKTYLIYASPGVVDLMWDLFLPFIVIPSEAYSNSGPLITLYCAVFEVSKARNVEKFYSDWSRFYATSTHDEFQTCVSMIPKKSLLAERDRLRKQVANQGDTEALAKLKIIFRDPDASIYMQEYLSRQQRDELP